MFATAVSGLGDQLYHQLIPVDNAVRSAAESPPYAIPLFVLFVGTEAALAMARNSACMTWLLLPASLLAPPHASRINNKKMPLIKAIALTQKISIPRKLCIPVPFH